MTMVGINMKKQSKILVTGASGFLGWNSAEYLSKKFCVFGMVHSNIPPIDTLSWNVVSADITKENDVLELVERIKPDLILHTAALTKPDVCEKEQELAWKINVFGTAVVTKAAELCQSRLIYISTDLVFDGTGSMYKEDSSVNPSLFYAKTKLMGEEVVKKWAGDYLIFRIAVMYGWGSPYHKSFMEWLISNICDKKTVSLFTDQYRSMLYVGQVPIMVEYAMQNEALWRRYTRETFHVGGEKINRYDFGLKVAECFSLPKDSIKAVTMAEVMGLAPRPADCSMNTSKMEKAFNLKPFTVNDGLEACL